MWILPALERFYVRWRTSLGWRNSLADIVCESGTRFLNLRALLPEVWRILEAFDSSRPVADAIFEDAVRLKSPLRVGYGGFCIIFVSISQPVSTRKSIYCGMPNSLNIRICRNILKICEPFAQPKKQNIYSFAIKDSSFAIKEVKL